MDCSILQVGLDGIAGHNRDPRGIYSLRSISTYTMTRFVALRGLDTKVHSAMRDIRPASYV